MTKYTWSGGIDDNILLEVVACRGSVNEPPNGLIIDREDNRGGSFINVDADERFMVLLRIDGVNVARLNGHEIIKYPWEYERG